MADLKAKLPTLAGIGLGAETVEAADDFAYNDPVDGSVSTGQGVRVLFESGARIVFRLSGTGTEGATLRVCIERFEPERFDAETQSFLAPLIAIADELAGITSRTGCTAADVIT